MNAACEPIVETRSLCKRFGERTAVDHLDLSVEAGVCYGLLGPNGAGKTTTMRMIYGVTKPTSGRVRVFGLDIARHGRRVRSRLGVTLQDSVLIEALTPEENLRVFGRYHLIEAAELERRIEEVIEFLHLESHRKVPVRHLSGGFQRRLAIALSLINRPDLLILDEPTTGLDPAVRLALWSRIRDLRARGTTILLTTHYMDEAERLCDRVGILSHGKLVAEGSPSELIERTLARETVEFDCTAEEERTLLQGFAGSTRRLRAGSRLIVHLDDAGALVEHIRRYDGRGGRHFVVRPTNLEDVYLALTGSSLEGGQ
ncbi:MAG: ABC transporter ATP-binding protein [Candidatus Dadabacteria bacterium]|nr:MAG: ABC transporter ATP-binding protein [Candidatus Dadabacteria bacterium]